MQGRFGPCSGVLQVREDDTGPAHEKGGMLADQQCNLFPQILSTLPETLVYYWIYKFSEVIMCGNSILRGRVYSNRLGIETYNSF